ncbi:hypothetical protein F2Q69_00025701 [Brassica cretica]|uniref:Secreted protein n=1 Tax=Brassica cretica TaxID=69181 RepID=A0A8S9RV33_BRACR|nr:hypothetical protein F2Q69_00025701 [Brassica cretica]
MGTGASGSVNILRQLLFVSLTQEAVCETNNTVFIDAADADAETCGNQTNRAQVCLKFATKPFRRTRASRDGYNASQSSNIFGRGFFNCVCASFLATFELSGLHTCSG